MEKINGTFSAEQLNALTLPIAWSGTVGAEVRAQHEAERAAVVAVAREALASDPEAIAVEIKDGEVVLTVHAEGEITIETGAWVTWGTGTETDYGLVVEDANGKQWVSWRIGACRTALDQHEAADCMEYDTEDEARTACMAARAD